jgi:hypothetical protein
MLQPNLDTGIGMLLLPVLPDTYREGTLLKHSRITLRAATGNGKADGVVVSTRTNAPACPRNTFTARLRSLVAEFVDLLR